MFIEEVQPVKTLCKYDKTCSVSNKSCKGFKEIFKSSYILEISPVVLSEIKSEENLWNIL